MEYPNVARFAHNQGDVSLTVRVGPDGAVTSATATSGPTILRRPTEENMRAWKFQPGQERTLNLMFKFVLEEPAMDFPRSRWMFDAPDTVTIISNRQAVVGAP